MERYESYKDLENEYPNGGPANNYVVMVGGQEMRWDASLHQWVVNEGATHCDLPLHDIEGDVVMRNRLKVCGELYAYNISPSNKGLFFTAEDLIKAYPKGKKGDWAYVGTTAPYAVYKWDKGWNNSGEQGNLEVNLNPYATNERLDTVEADLNAKVDAVDAKVDAVDAKVDTNVASLNTEVDQLKEKNLNEFPKYDGEREITKTINPSSTATPTAIYYATNLNKFVAFVGGVLSGEYYAGWNETDEYAHYFQYNDSYGNAIANKTYWSKESNQFAYCDGKALVKVGATHVTWGSTSNIGKLNATGLYYISGTRTSLEDGLPILNLGEFVAWLRVANVGGNRFISQTLELGNKVGKDTKVYTRSYDGSNWSEWQVLQGIHEKGAILNVEDINKYTDNGMYSGLVTDGCCGSIIQENIFPTNRVVSQWLTTFFIYNVSNTKTYLYLYKEN